MLSESVDEQFKLLIGNICEECYILETEETFTFCENEEHFEIFQSIWSNRLSNSISTYFRWLYANVSDYGQYCDYLSCDLFPRQCG